MTETRKIEITVNGVRHQLEVETRVTLADCLRHHLGLTGTHLGCEHGVCGACTVLVDGQAARSCLMLAVQADGAAIATVEGLAGDDGTLHPLQQAFLDTGGVQCGFCIPGMILSGVALLEQNPHPTRDEIRRGIAGNLCRCTGYRKIVEAIESVADGR